MKKMLALLLVLLLAIPALPALAQHVSPPPNPPGLPIGSEYGIVSESAKRGSHVQISTVRAPRLGQEAEWSFAPRTGNGDVTYRVNIWEYGTGTVPTVYKSSWLPAGQNTFTYTFYETGKFYLVVYIQNEKGEIYQDIETIEVADVPGTPSVASRVHEIVAECRGQVSGEYETALWLHDWIISHACYDGSYSYYAPDGILFHGTGVCDSYSKLYHLLLTEAGFQCQRIRGQTSGGSHSWNAVRIDGEWCFIDTTWDDPFTGQPLAVTGYERYDYFGLNDSLMRLDHSYTADVSCSSLANCYYYRARQHRIWMYHILTEIEQRLAAGETQFSVDTQGIACANVYENGFYSYYNGSYAEKLSFFSAELLSLDTWPFLNSALVHVAFSYDSDLHTMLASVSDETVQGRIIRIPQGTAAIEAEAFMNDTAVEEVFIPASVRSIGSRAFAGCVSLKVIHFADGNSIDVAHDFLSGTGTGSLTIDAPANSTVAQNIEIYLSYR